MYANIFQALHTSEGQAQFWGAFFAAVFSLLTLGAVKAVNSVISRRNKHYNALVILETELNRHVARMYDTVYVLKGVLKTHEDKLVSFNNFGSFTVTPIKKYDSLADVGIINKLFSYDHGLERLNDDMCNLSDTYIGLRAALIDGKMKFNEFMGIFPDFSNNLNFQIRGWEKQIDEAIDISAQVRLMIRRDRGLLKRVKGWLVRRGMKPLSEEAIMAEKLELLSEVEQTRKESKKEIEQLLHGK